MALIYCSECGKEISDTCKRCPHCGYKLKNNSSKIKKVGMAAILATGVIGAIVYYNITHESVSMVEMAVINSIEAVQNQILNPDSLIVYECEAGYYKTKVDGLLFTLDTLPEELENDCIPVYLRVGAENKMGGITEAEYIFIFDKNMNEMYGNEVEDFDDRLLLVNAKSSEEDWTNYKTKELKNFIKMIDSNVMFKMKNTFPKVKNKEIDELVEIFVNSNLEEQDFDIAREYATRASSNKQQEKYENEIEEYIYDLGQNALDEDKYETALNYFYLCTTIDDEKVEECINGMHEECYQEGIKLLEQKEYNDAAEIFEELGDYKNSIDMIAECKYQYAMDNYDKKKYSFAKDVFETIIDYADSKEMMEVCDNAINERLYQNAKKFFDNEEWVKASGAFGAIGGYKDAAELQKECEYQQGLEYLENKNYNGASIKFKLLGDYKDSELLLEKIDNRKK